jgi:hypothetical protein
MSFSSSMRAPFSLRACMTRLNERLRRGEWQARREHSCENLPPFHGSVSGGATIALDKPIRVPEAVKVERATLEIRSAFLARRFAPASAGADYAALPCILKETTTLTSCHNTYFRDTPFGGHGAVMSWQVFARMFPPGLLSTRTRG